MITEWLKAPRAVQTSSQDHRPQSGALRSIAVVFLAILVAPSAQPADCAVSGNMVGYVNLSLPAGGSRILIANPLNGTNNHLNTILPLPDVADGVTILRWNPATQSYGDPIIFMAGLGWYSVAPDPNWLILNLGEGFFLQNPTASPLNVTFVGEVPEGTLVTAFPPGGGMGMLASKVPQARRLGESGAAGTLQFPAEDGDRAMLWNVASQSFDIYDFMGGFGWDPNDPVIGVGQGFIVQKAPGATQNAWTRTFVVSCASGPRLRIELRPGVGVQVTWSASGWQLEEAGDPEGPWTSVPGNPVSPFVIPTASARKFFRLARSTCLVTLCPDNQVLASADPSGAPAVFTAMATNVCGGTNVPVVCTPPSGTIFPLGTNTVTCVASEPSLNSDVCSFTVTVLPGAPRLSIRVSQIELCWETFTNAWYRPEYRSALTTNQWAPLAPWFRGDGNRFCTNDALYVGQVQRFYQVAVTNSAPPP
jgi:hypothetical protein